MKNCLIIFSLLVLIGCKNHNDINDKSKRNGNWVWWVDANTGKGAWIPIGDKTTVTDGEYTEFYFNGNIYAKGKLIKGKRVDTTFLYDKNGQLYEYDKLNPSPDCNCNYRINNKIDTFCQYIVNDGPHKIYSRDGSLYEMLSSTNHAIHGIVMGYYADGNKKYLRNYIKDSSWEIKYYENGQKEDSSYDFNNVGNFAFCKNWYQNGQLQAETKWRNDGIQDGIAKEYYEDFDKPQSELKTISTWKNGIEDGMQLDYYVNGQLKDSLNVSNGSINGISKTFYENSGKIEKIMIWENGIQNGIAIRYYESGMLEDSFNVINGDVDGIKKRWYENGKLELISAYEKGNCIREKKYNNDGSLSSDSTY